MTTRIRTGRHRPGDLEKRMMRRPRRHRIGLLVEFEDADEEKHQNEEADGDDDRQDEPIMKLMDLPSRWG